MSTEEIFNYIKVNDQLITGGQPTEEQLRETAAEGFTAIINLALVNPPRTPEDEAGLVESLGMSYYHIPVQWNDPTDADYDEFDRALSGLTADRVLIHCAANFRVTAFYSLYAQQRLGWSEARADEFRAAIWGGSDYPIWEAFIARKKAELSESPNS